MSNISSKINEQKEYFRMNNNSRIRMKPYNYSIIANTVIYDTKLSAKAKGIYIMICAECQKVNYTVYKSTIAKLCTDGETSFETGWKELKEAGYLIQYKSQAENGKWIYEYELLEEPVKKENVVSESSEEVEKPHPDFPPLVFPPLENQGIYNKQEKRNTKERNIKESKEKNSLEEPSLDIPSLNDVVEYCKNRKNNIDPQSFYEYYSNLNWKDSNGKPVKNWKLKVISWESHQKSKNNSNKMPDFTLKKNQDNKEYQSIDDIIKNSKAKEPKKEEHKHIPFEETELILEDRVLHW